MKCVYIVRAGQSHYKIGVASNIVKRIKALQTSNGSKIDLIISKQFDDAYAVEKDLHTILQKAKLNGGREWFDLTPQQLIELLIQFNNYPAVEQSVLENLYEQLVENDKTRQYILNKIRLVLEGYQVMAAVPISDKELVTKELKKQTSDEDYISMALSVFKQSGKASTSLLQRKLSIGYGKAARIMELLQDQGHIGPMDGNRPRELFIDTAIKKAHEIINQQDFSKV